jgi:PAS domain S-box-containing protein
MLRKKNYKKTFPMNKRPARKNDRIADSGTDWGEFFHALGQPTLILDANHTILAANPAAEKLAGLSQDDLRGRKCHEIFHGIDMPLGGCPMDKILQSGRMETSEMQVETTGGVFLVSCTPVADEDGRIEKIIHVNTDITEYKRTEKALKESDTLFRAFMDYLPSLVIIKDHDLRPIYFNRSFGDLFPVEEWMGKTPEATFPPEIAGAMIEKDRQAFADGYVQYEETWKDRNGNDHVLETRKFRIDSSDALPLLGVIINDISERKKAEDELRESEKRYRQLIEQAADGIFVVDMKGNYLLVNSTFCKMLGYTEDELLKLNVLDTYPDELRDIGQQRVARVSSGEGLRFERTMKRKDGTIFHVELSVSRLDDGRHQGIIHDITNSKKAEEEKKMLESQLAQAQKTEAIGTLAGGIAHDFNNILSAIIGYTELAIHDFSDPAKAVNELREVLKAGERSRNLVRQILMFSRKTETQYSPVALHDIIVESIRMMRSVLPTSIEIRHDLQFHGLVMADPTQIHQVMMNLCTNAAHAMDETGGVLNVTLKKMHLDGDRASRDLDLPPGPYVNLAVSDTGRGMTPEVMARIFDPYFTTKEVGKGTGLGLAVVHGIVKSHGGAVTCRSSPGKGATFDIYLPEIELGKEATETLEKEPLPSGTGRILFVDDEPALTNLAEKMLANLGYTVVTRTDSADALELFRKDPDGFDLVITDMTMPGMTGDRLAQKLKEIRHDIPIILCTGYSDHMSEEKAKEIGIQEFIMKPLNMRSLAETTRKILKEK